tara:strand:+ start:2752 stop:3027 length:276 start_codon:yes stop_codon:yes gene_type:complete
MTWKEEVKKEIIKNNYDLGYFTLQEFYESSLKNLQMKFLKNNTCEFTIRRTLQELRDEGYLRFLDNNGQYEVISEENKEWNKFTKKYHENN